MAVIYCSVTLLSITCFISMVGYFLSRVHPKPSCYFQLGNIIFAVIISLLITVYAARANSNYDLKT